MEWMVSVKALVISMSVVLMGLAMKVSVPLSSESLGSHVPVMWSSFLTWLRPPYLYIIINVIIITIVASSRFHHHHHHDDRAEDYHEPAPTTTNVSDPGHESTGCYDQEMKIVSREFGESDQVRSVVLYEHRDEEEEEEEEAEVVEAYHADDEAAVIDKFEIPDEAVADHEVLLSRLSPRVETPPRRIDYSPDKPLFSARFGQRKPVKPIPEGGRSSLKVSKPKRHETLENTWKAITEGRSMPLSRHMKKCETWENHGRRFDYVGDDQIEPLPPLVMMKKSETFKDRTNQPMPAHDQVMTYSSPVASSKLQKEPSLSQDELNKRVEAFIQKFNEEMRLQRQESLNQYMEMINRGSH
ncbi:CFE protein [Trema orientale]|uniref:CFE protein n=1 Tax=Trema orientale TaxID=63057 RepID=A0A2P5G0Z0_TREOI|nr:CFE protein [Trema orientale]